MTDIKQALAEALRQSRVVQWSAWEKAGDNDYQMMAAASFAAKLAKTPAMQALARQAAIGAAVERLPDGGCTLMRREDGSWRVYLRGEPWPELVAGEQHYNTLVGEGDTLPEAIAAALGDDERQCPDCKRWFLEGADLARHECDD